MGVSSLVKLKDLELTWSSPASLLKKFFDEGECGRLIQKIVESYAPSSFKEVGDLFKGEGKYHFITDFRELVSHGVDFFKESMASLFSSETNTCFRDYLLEQTPDVFRPFMEGVFTPDFKINVAHLYGPNAPDGVSWSEKIWPHFGFDASGHTFTGYEGIADVIVVGGAGGSSDGGSGSGGDGGDGGDWGGDGGGGDDIIVQIADFLSTLGI
jgi:hypothetical protein